MTGMMLSLRQAYRYPATIATSTARLFHDRLIIVSDGHYNGQVKNAERGEKRKRRRADQLNLAGKSPSPLPTVE
jgi:hypothetical protein